jgi:SHS2 domain-containing protein
MHEWVDHTGELELHVRGPACAAVFAEASAALGEVLGERGGGAVVERALRVEGRDVPALLADWLAELAWLAESESLIVERVEALSVDDGIAVGTVAARRGSPRGLVKAVTYHGLACEADGEGWRATVVFDV